MHSHEYTDSGTSTQSNTRINTPINIRHFATKHVNKPNTARTHEPIEHTTCTLEDQMNRINKNRIDKPGAEEAMDLID